MGDGIRISLHVFLQEVEISWMRLERDDSCLRMEVAKPDGLIADVCPGIHDQANALEGVSTI